MLRRSAQITVVFFLALCPALLSGQAAPPQFYFVCYSQANLPTVYFSGVLVGPATAMLPFRFAFVQFLIQRFSYQGNVLCSPTNNLAIAQNWTNTEATALRKVNKNVQLTGWTETAQQASAAAEAAAAVNAAKNASGSAPPSPAAKTQQGQPAAAGAKNNNTASGVATALDDIFGTSGSSNNTNGSSAGGGAGAGAAGGAAGAKAGQAKSTGTGANASGGSNGAANQSPAAELATTLAAIFGKNSTNSSTAGGNAARSTAGPGTQPASRTAPAKSTPSGLPVGALGEARSGNTSLVVYGCGRQEQKVACVTNLTNQNQQDTLVHSADIWKDAFIVDDRGDRHQRTDGFFLNIDGDQRQQLDIYYGKTAQFILMFDGVPPKVEKVALRSATGGLNVADISLTSPDAASNANAPASPQQ